jgi:hypothetical protein
MCSSVRIRKASGEVAFRPSGRPACGDCVADTEGR